MGDLSCPIKPHSPDAFEDRPCQGHSIPNSFLCTLVSVRLEFGGGCAGSSNEWRCHQNTWQLYATEDPPFETVNNSPLTRIPKSVSRWYLDAFPIHLLDLWGCPSGGPWLPPSSVHAVQNVTHGDLPLNAHPGKNARGKNHQGHT